MKAYRMVWMPVVGLLVCLGLLAAVVSLPVSAALMILLLAAPLDAGLRVTVGNTAHLERHEWARTLTRLTVRDTIVMVAIGGLGAAIGTATSPLLLLAAASSPPVIRVVTAHVDLSSDRSDDSSDSPLPAATPPAVSPAPPAAGSIDPLPSVSVLDAADLCLAWRRSYTALQRARSPVERLQIVALRQACLDELERRAPQGFAAWLEAGARAAGDPSKIFTKQTHPGNPSPSDGGTGAAPREGN